MKFQVIGQQPQVSYSIVALRRKCLCVQTCEYVRIYVGDEHSLPMP